MKKINPFETVEKIFSTKNVEVTNPFFVNKILSYQPDTVLLTVELNKYMSRMPSWALKAIFSIGIKKRRSRVYLNYPQKSKKIDKNQQLLKNKISSTFCVNENHANQIIRILRDIGEQPEKFFGIKT